KRSACGPEPSGYGPVTDNPRDDAASFLANPVYANAANSAAAPAGYVQTFKNLNASSSAYGYLGFSNLQSYSPQTCALKCNAIKGCMGINLYFERDPKYTPDKTLCPNPASLTQIKCVYWGGPVTTDTTNNPGRTWVQFSVVVAGSNGYVNQTVAAPSGYSDATYLGNTAINAPYNALGYNTYMGAKVFASGPFNASLCAAACNAQNVYNLANPPSDRSPVQTCQFFNTYILSLNGKTALGQYCAMYSSSWTNKYATNVGQYRGNDHYTVGFSYAFSNLTDAGTTPNPAAAVAQAKGEISASSLQSYCSTFLGYNDLNAYITATSTKTPVSTVTSTSTLKVKASSSTTSSSSKASSLSKRALPSSSLATPTALTKYPGSIISSACSALVTEVPKTATVTVSTATITGSTSRSTVVKTITTTTR
ncbi:glycoside hydrolase, partial [Aureobasidium melanogenum]